MTRLIKKYKNRRLYDTEKSQYITVEELQRYIMDGIAFRVIDSVNEKDITNATLLQIFVEMENGSSQFFSGEMLKQLIILANHPMSQSFKKIIEQFFANIQQSTQSNPYLSNYNQAKDAWTKQMQQMMDQWQSFLKR